MRKLLLAAIAAISLGASAAHAQLTKMTIATGVDPAFSQFYVAKEGGLFEKAPNWQSFAITDGRLITGQNPASSTAGAESLLNLIGEMQLGRISSAA